MQHLNRHAKLLKHRSVDRLLSLTAWFNILWAWQN